MWRNNKPKPIPIVRPSKIGELIESNRIEFNRKYIDLNDVLRIRK